MILTLFGVKLKLFPDEGTFRVHLGVNLGYIDPSFLWDNRYNE